MSSDTSLLISAWTRPLYLKRVLASWAQVPEVKDLRTVTVALGRSNRASEQMAVIAAAQEELGREITVRADSDLAARSPGMHRALGEAASAAFADDPDLEFLVCSEEDVVVSDDVLRYFAWARQLRDEHPEILVCEAHNAFGQGWHPAGAVDDPDADQAAVQLVSTFHPWTFATWRDRWEQVLEPGWDWNCSKGTRGYDSGYDWTINYQMMHGGFTAPAPDASRSQNIGRYGGVYANPALFDSTQSQSFRPSRGDVSYRLATPALTR